MGLHMRCILINGALVFFIKKSSYKKLESKLFVVEKKKGKDLLGDFFGLRFAPHLQEMAEKKMRLTDRWKILVFDF